MGETNVDTILGQLVVEKELCSAEEVKQCRDLIKERAQQDNPLSLAEALIGRKYLTKTQMSRTKAMLEETRQSHKIPGFQMLERLGAGAMAVVFKAKQLSLDRDVAIKVLPKRLSENPDYVERFYREGRAAAKLNHNNIVQAIDVGSAGAYHYFVMEYVEGKTVYDDITSNSVYPEDSAIKIIMQIAEALQHAHERGLIHRDVKPKNIMITKTGVAKLADMGLARETSDQATAQNEAGRAYGTPYYISPEQIRGEVDIDFRADIYSLGATFYHMVTGQVPFEAPTPSAVMHKHLKTPLVPPDHLNRNLSVGVAEVIEVMMAKRRQDRYSDIRLLLEDLQAVQRGEPPMQAHQMFDAGTLESLEEGSSEADASLEEAIGTTPGQLAMRMAVIILSGALIAAILVIIVMARKPM